MKELFEKYGVIKTGHFKLTSGKHSGQYINKDAIYCNPFLFNKIIMRIAASLYSYEDKFDIVTGPAIAGAILAAPVALKLNKIFVYPEKVEDDPLAGNPNKWTKMVFRRGYNKILQNKRVWIIEDIITTGSSVEKTIMAIRGCRGNVVGISAIWNRQGYQSDEGILLRSLINNSVLSYWPDECPSCKAGKILQDPKA